MKSISDLGDLRGKTVLLRSDLNVPLDGSTITDDGRIRASVPTIQELTKAGARVVVVAHLGRPKGEPEAKYSLQPVVAFVGVAGAVGVSGFPAGRAGGGQFGRHVEQDLNVRRRQLQPAVLQVVHPGDHVAVDPLV